MILLLDRHPDVPDRSTQSRSPAVRLANLVGVCACLGRLSGRNGEAGIRAECGRTTDPTAMQVTTLQRTIDSMPGTERGSLTKEPPLSRIDATLRLIRPNMTLGDLRAAVAQNDKNTPREDAPHKDAPGLLRNRFLFVDEGGRIVYDRFLSLVQAHGFDAPLVRKVMYFVWAWRDDRIRAFVTQIIADKSGRWDANRILDKSRGDFFAQFVNASSAQKIRSNFEFFLSETGILTNTGGVSLDMADGWLAEAALAASQHEIDPAIRAAMVRRPSEVLFQLGLNGLANLTAADRPKAQMLRVADFVQEEADSLLETPTSARVLRDWKDRQTVPTSSGAVTTTVNLVALERANASHLLLERLVAKAMSEVGLKARASDAIDILAEAAEQTLICEIKSCTARNFHGQIRRGVSQLLEYRFLYRETLKGEIVLALVVETEPPTRKMWLRDCLRSLGIALVWKEHGTERLLATGPVAPPLDNLVTVV